MLRGCCLEYCCALELEACLLLCLVQPLADPAHRTRYGTMLMLRSDLV
jgi:hypothetical protein